MVATNLFAYEVRKTFQRKVVWWLAAGLAGLLLLLLTGMHFTRMQAAGLGADISQIPSPLWPSGFVLSLVSFMDPTATSGVVAIVLSAALWAQAYQWRTLHLLVSRGASRGPLVATTFGALLLATLLIVGVGTVVAGAASALLTLGSGEVLVLGEIDALQTVLAVVRLVIALLPLAALTLVFGVLTRSVAGAMGAGFGYLFVGESMLGMVLSLLGLDKVALYLPRTLAAFLGQYGTLVLVGSTVEAPVNALSAVIGCIGWTVFFVRLAGALLRRQDLTG